jgi:hypothetical protein
MTRIRFERLLFSGVSARCTLAGIEVDVHDIMMFLWSSFWLLRDCSFTVRNTGRCGLSLTAASEAHHSAGSRACFRGRRIQDRSVGLLHKGNTSKLKIAVRTPEASHCSERSTKIPDYHLIGAFGQWRARPGRCLLANFGISLEVLAADIFITLNGRPESKTVLQILCTNLPQRSMPMATYRYSAQREYIKAQNSGPEASHCRLIAVRRI